MQIKKLTIQEEKSLLPTQLDFYQILNIRGSAYFTEQKKLLKSLVAGDYGEQKVMKYIHEYAPSHWTVLQNVWLRDFDRFECDLILLTSNQVYVLEVKNYQGRLLYENGRCFYNSIETSLNPFEQIRTNHINLKQMCTRLSSSIDVQAAVIFAGDDHEVMMKTPLENIRVVSSNGIRNFILDIVQQEKRVQNESIDHERLFQLFKSCEIKNPYQPAPLSESEMKHIRPGIYCASCYRFNVHITKFKVICPCGLHESREESILRTICDYGVLTYGRPLVRKKLMGFFNGIVSHTYLISICHKYFTVINKGSYTCYVNPGLPYKQINHQFIDIKPRHYYHTNGDMSIFSK